MKINSSGNRSQGPKLGQTPQVFYILIPSRIMAILHIAALCREGIENRELALELVCGLIFDVAGTAGRAPSF